VFRRSALRKYRRDSTYFSEWMSYRGDGVWQVGVGAGMGFASRRGRWEEEGKREDERVSNRLIEGDVRTRDSSREG
jgi:hypothetical protein